MDEEAACKKAVGLLLEFGQLRSTAEAACIIEQELVPGGAKLAKVVEAWMVASFEKKEIDCNALKARLPAAALLLFLRHRACASVHHYAWNRVSWVNCEKPRTM